MISVLKQLSKENGITVTRLAKELGVSRQTVYAIFKNHKLLRADNFSRLCEIFDVEYGVLVDNNINFKNQNMGFKEFEYKFEFEGRFRKGYYEIIIGKFEIYITRLSPKGPYFTKMYHASIDSDADDDDAIETGKYNTLREAYEALKEICKLNNVKM